VTYAKAMTTGQR